VQQVQHQSDAPHAPRAPACSDAWMLVTVWGICALHGMRCLQFELCERITFSPRAIHKTLVLDKIPLLAEFTNALCQEKWLMEGGRLSVTGQSESAGNVKLEWKPEEETTDAFGELQLLSVHCLFATPKPHCLYSTTSQNLFACRFLAPM